MHYIVVGQHEMHMGFLPKQKKKLLRRLLRILYSQPLDGSNSHWASVISGIAVCLLRGCTSLCICPMLPHVALYRESHKSVKKSGCALFSVCSVRGSFGSGLTTTFMFNHGRNAINTFIRKWSLIPVTRCMWNVTKISKIVGFFLVKRRFLKIL